MKEFSGRLQSIDIFRAITMFLMVFVNDVDGVSKIPAWIKHSHADADNLGFADTIFPAFLFIVGLSLPFALTTRMKRGDSLYRISVYILSRSIALIIMGLFHVNLEYYSTDYLPKPVWSILTTIGFFLIWLDYPKDMQKKKRFFFQAAGILLLMIMAILFKGNNDGVEVGLQPHWWGILGLIGWTYGICAILFVLTKGKPGIQLAAFLIFAGVNIAHHASVFSLSLPQLGNGAFPALTLAGVVISLLYSRAMKENRIKPLGIFFLIGISTFVLGWLIRPYSGGISKIHATPTWVFICIAISVVFFAATIWLVDVKGKSHYFRLIRSAGTSTLTCYLIPYILYATMQLAGFKYPVFLSQGLGGILRSFGVAFLAVWITWLLEKRHLRLKV